MHRRGDGDPAPCGEDRRQPEHLGAVGLRREVAQHRAARCRTCPAAASRTRSRRGRAGGRRTRRPGSSGRSGVRALEQLLQRARFGRADAETRRRASSAPSRSSSPAPRPCTCCARRRCVSFVASAGARPALLAKLMYTSPDSTAASSFSSPDRAATMATSCARPVDVGERAAGRRLDQAAQPRARPEDELAVGRLVPSGACPERRQHRAVAAIGADLEVEEAHLAEAVQELAQREQLGPARAPGPSACRRRS